jgi:hypothetical protein
LLAGLIFLALFSSPAVSQEDIGWPREFVTEDARIVAFQPQVDGWESYTKIEGLIAVAVTPTGSETELVGSVRFTANTKTNYDTRTVLIHDKTITSVDISTTDAALAKKMEAAIRSVQTKPHTISLDRMLAMIEGTDTKPPPSVGIAVDPPVIFFSIDPAGLMMFNGEPIYSEIADTDLMFAINTNWDLFLQKKSSEMYLLYGDRWLMATDVNGPWAPVQKLPESFLKLPDHENWQEVRKHLNAPPIKKEDIPIVYVSMKPAELILIDGKPIYKQIPGTRLMYVTNTNSDLFMHIGDAHYYFLVSGRWFKSESFTGPWTFATPELPEDFANIPDDHITAEVLSSVPGTPQAKQAAQQAQVPQQATVNRAEATVEVTYSGEPEFQPIEDTDMTYAVNTPYDVIYVSGSYYCCYQAVWFISTSPTGPWVVCDTIPAEIYSIPASSPVHHVTYVQVYHHTTTTVEYGYTSGYMGCYFLAGVIVFGTGYYYPPYYHYPYGYPIYYPYPYSYGVHARYNPYTGTYSRGHSVYGPYGGAGRGVAYNPTTGTYARGAAAWGPGGGTAAMTAYNPRTGTRATTRQSYNQYAQWGESVVSRGDRWAHTGHYTDAQGTRFGFETSDGAKGVGWVGDDHSGGVVKGRNDDLYVGKDGNVYKRDQDGWHRNDDGNWNKIEPPSDLPEREARREEMQRQAGETGRDRQGGADRSQLSPEQRAAAREQAQSRDRSGVNRDQAQQRSRDQSAVQRSQPSRTPQKSQGNMDRLNKDAQRRSQGTMRSNQYQTYRRNPSAARSRPSRGGRRR